MIKELRRFKDLLRFTKNRLLYDFSAPAALESFNFAAIKHIVVSKMDGKLGDSQVITPFFTQIKKHYPDIKFSVLCSNGIAEIYSACLKVDQTVILPAKPQKAAIKKAVKEVTALGKCDLIVTTEPHFRARDFMLENFLKPQFTAGFENNAACVNINLLKRNYGKHISEYFKDLLVLGGITDPDMHYLPLITEASADKLSSYFDHKKVYGIAPYGASKHRRLDDNTITAICDCFCKFDENACLCPLVAPQDRAVIEMLSARYGNKIVTLPASLSATDLAYAVSRLKFLVSVDTANVHLASATSTPLFALYSGTDPDGIVRWGPAPWHNKAQAFHKEGVLIENLHFDDFKTELYTFMQTVA